MTGPDRPRYTVECREESLSIRLFICDISRPILGCVPTQSGRVLMANICKCVMILALVCIVCVLQMMLGCLESEFSDLSSPNVWAEPWQSPDNSRPVVLWCVESVVSSVDCSLTVSSLAQISVSSVREPLLPAPLISDLPGQNTEQNTTFIWTELFPEEKCEKLF